MKSILFKIATAAFVLAIASTLTAAPPDYGKPHMSVKKYQSAATVGEIQALKKGDRYALVCTECKSIDVKEVTDDKGGEALCHDGGTLHCDSCKKKVNIKRAGGPGKEVITSAKVTYVNAEGKECMFLVPLKD
jgi:hypothetical protein